MIDLRKCGKPNKKQLRMGISVELEHTRSRKVAERIASQHLCEYKDYYTALRKMESELRRK